MTVIPAILPLDDPDWWSFVEGQPEATPFHHPAWVSVVTEAYGFHGFVFVLRGDAGEILIGLPMIEVGRNRRWVSLAFTDYCGPLGPEAFVDELLRAIDDERRAQRVPALEIRADLHAHPPCRSSIVGYRHLLELDRDPEVTFALFSRSQVQRQIKKAKREGVEVRPAVSRDDLLDTFYSLHLSTRKRLGVPIQPRGFFELLWDRVIEPGLGSVFVADVDGAAAAAAVFVGWHGRLYYKYGASDSSTWSRCPNHAVFWSAIQWACENEYRVLDFGRTDRTNEGLRSFKAHWGTTESDLVYSSLGDVLVDRTNGVAFRTLGTVIRNSPEVVCRYLGEHLYRYAA